MKTENFNGRYFLYPLYMCILKVNCITDVLNIGQLLPNLRSLTMCSTRPIPVQIAIILANCQQIRSLTLYHISPSASTLMLLQNLENLAELCFYDAHLTNLECR